MRLDDVLGRRAASANYLTLDQPFFLRAIITYFLVANAAYTAVVSASREPAYFTPNIMLSAECGVAKVANRAMFCASGLEAFLTVCKVGAT